MVIMTWYYNDEMKAVFTSDKFYCIDLTGDVKCINKSVGFNLVDWDVECNEYHARQKMIEYFEEYSKESISKAKHELSELENKHLKTLYRLKVGEVL